MGDITQRLEQQHRRERQEQHQRTTDTSTAERIDAAVTGISDSEIAVELERTTTTATRTEGAETVIDIDEQTETTRFAVRFVDAHYERFLPAPADLLAEAFAVETAVDAVPAAPTVPAIPAGEAATGAPDVRRRVTPAPRSGPAARPATGTAGPVPRVDGPHPRPYDIDDPGGNGAPRADPVPTRAAETGTADVLAAYTAAAPDLSIDPVPAVPTVRELGVDAADDEYGVTDAATYTVAESGTAADAMERLLESAASPLSGEVREEAYTDTEDGETYVSTWVDIDGYDMRSAEFFINGELADEALDGYDVGPGDTVSVVTADVFADPDAEICGGDVHLEDVVPGRYGTGPGYVAG